MRNMLLMALLGVGSSLWFFGKHESAFLVSDLAHLMILLIAGLGLAWLGANTIRSFLFQVQALDAVTLAGTTGLILILALAVSVRSALRMARVDLATVLKME